MSNLWTIKVTEESLPLIKKLNDGGDVLIEDTATYFIWHNSDDAPNLILSEKEFNETFIAVLTGCDYQLTVAIEK